MKHDGSLLHEAALCPGPPQFMQHPLLSTGPLQWIAICPGSRHLKHLTGPNRSRILRCHTGRTTTGHTSGGKTPASELATLGPRRALYKARHGTGEVTQSLIAIVITQAAKSLFLEPAETMHRFQASAEKFREKLDKAARGAPRTQLIDPNV
nr:uncharacterized protein LOC121503190 [Drosophila kikkawai]